MSVKQKSSGRRSGLKDEPPEITSQWVAEADLWQGRRLIRRGRPPLKNPRQLLSLRLPPEVIAAWKASGPGWQTRMAEVLQKASPRPRRTASRTPSQRKPAARAARKSS
jgi:uncharacterized protein (DUF4415 family)